MNTVSLSVDVSFSQIIDVVKKLSLHEKQLLSEVIWDDNIAIPTEQQTLVLERITKAKNEHNQMQDWDTIENSLK